MADRKLRATKLIMNRINRAAREDSQSVLNNIGDHARRARELEERKQRAVQRWVVNLNKNAQLEKRDALKQLIANRDALLEQDKLGRLAEENRARALRRIINNINKAQMIDQLNAVNKLKRFNQDGKNQDRRARNLSAWICSRLKAKDNLSKIECYKKMVDYALRLKGVSLREGMMKNRLISMLNQKQQLRGAEALRNLVKWNQDQK